MNKNVKIIATNLICPICNNIQVIQRRKSRQKSYGHLKLLYCYKCKKYVNHIEIKDGEINETIYM